MKFRPFLVLGATICAVLSAAPAFAIVQPPPVPEPATLGLLGLGVVGVLLARRR